jgi:O-antigen ligase
LRFGGVLLVVVPAAAYGVQRLGPASLNLSVADGVLLGGMVVALPFVPWESPRLRRVLVAAAAYQLVLACSVLGHPTTRAIIEWGHRILLVVGAVMVGASLARFGKVAPALRLYLVASAVIALASTEFALAHHFAPAYPFGIQKNDAGLLMAYAFVISIAGTRAAQIPVKILNPLRFTLLLGLLCTQARGPMIAATLVVAALQLRGRRSIRATALVVVAALLMTGIAVAVTEGQVLRARNNPGTSQFYGVGAREVTYGQALRFWSHNTLLGAGLRYFRDPSLATSEPHDVIVEALAESGIVGLLALVILLAATWLVLRGLGDELAVLARCLVVMELVAGLADIYWVAGRGSFPWVFVGIAVGAESMRIRLATRAASPHLVRPQTDRVRA